MKTYRMLVLTDHRTHTEQNSFYELINRLYGSKYCQYLEVASRGFVSNAPFFRTHNSTSLRVRRIAEDIAYQEDAADILPDRSSSLSAYDVIFLRLPHPTPNQFWDFLVHHYPERQIINRPSGIQEVGSKAFLCQFPGLCPPIKLCRTVDEIQAFAAKFPIVLKPLKNYGGKGIVKIENGRVSAGNQEQPLSDFLATFGGQSEPYLGMKFLKQVHRGDKRIVVVNRTILGATLRTPPPDSWLCNASQGGSVSVATVDEAEQHIVHTLADVLQQKGVVMYGLDTLVNDDGKRVLSEINTMSIGGLVQLEQLSGRPVVQHIADLLWHYVNSEMYGDDLDRVQ